MASPLALFTILASISALSTALDDGIVVEATSHGHKIANSEAHALLQVRSRSDIEVVQANQLSLQVGANCAQDVSSGKMVCDPSCISASTCNKIGAGIASWYADTAKSVYTVSDPAIRYRDAQDPQSLWRVRLNPADSKACPGSSVDTCFDDCWKSATCKSFAWNQEQCFCYMSTDSVPVSDLSTGTSSAVTSGAPATGDDTWMANYVTYDIQSPTTWLTDNVKTKLSGVWQGEKFYGGKQICIRLPASSTGSPTGNVWGPMDAGGQLLNLVHTLFEDKYSVDTTGKLIEVTQPSTFAVNVGRINLELVENFENKFKYVFPHKVVLREDNKLEITREENTWVLDKQSGDNAECLMAL